MERIKEELYRICREKHPRATEESINSKINAVLSEEDNTKIIENYMANKDSVKENNLKWAVIISFLVDEVELKFKEAEDFFNINRGKVDVNTGETIYPIRSKTGKVVTGSLDKIEGLNYIDISNDLIKVGSLEVLLRNPLVLEEKSPIEALKIIEKYYDLPYFEKEAFKLRVFKKIENPHNAIKDNRISPPIINLESLFSAEGILSLQRKAAIRIRIMWKHHIYKVLIKPYYDIIKNGLNVD